MADRVDNSSTSSAQRVGSSSTTPRETNATNQAAADFASLLGSETSQPNTGDVAEQRPPEERVEERRDDRQESGDDGNDSQGEQGKKKEQSQTKEPAAPGDAILQSMGKGEATVKAAAPSAGNQTLESIVQQVADQMLVADAGMGREVRIMLKDAVLPGTEVRISQLGGKMQIQFVTDSSKSQELLAQNQAALQERLTEKLSKHDVVVSVEMESQGHGDQPQGESRGKQEQAEEES